ncbi:MAG: hypothetical protein AAFY76_12960 [Cyanobacteria bacterium J06649_11]
MRNSTNGERTFEEWKINNYEDIRRTGNSRTGTGILSSIPSPFDKIDVHRQARGQDALRVRRPRRSTRPQGKVR